MHSSFNMVNYLFMLSSRISSWSTYLFILVYRIPFWNTGSAVLTAYNAGSIGAEIVGTEIFFAAHFTSLPFFWNLILQI